MANKLQDGMIYIGGGGVDQYLTLKLANRHGLVTGATGTGKTVTLQVLAEGFSDAGVPVFAADIKGDLSGVAAMGEAKDFITKRCQDIGFDDFAPDKYPVVFWDLFGEMGHPIRATVSEMGPLLLSRLMSLNEVQEGVLNIIFKYADEHGLLLLDMKDLQAVLQLLGADKELQAELKAAYGNVSPQTVGTIQRQLLVLQQQGGDKFFGEPALDLKDLMRVTRDGRGTINILAADKLMSSPRLYATFLLWLMAELFEQLPEVGDPEKPKLVFFFDEAHLLFDEAPDALLQKVEQVVRLIRSKGVGIYFVSQNPIDVPDKVSAQLGNRAQHALRAFTPREQKAVKAAAETFRPNPKLNTAKVIMELGKGEALVSVLEGNGTPTMVERTLMRPPSARIGPVTDAERRAVMAASPFAGKYEDVIDRESAFERLSGKAAASAGPQGHNAPTQAMPAPQEAAAAGGGIMDQIGGVLGGIFGQSAPPPVGPRGGRAPQRQSVGEAVVKSVARSVASSVGRQVGTAIIRGVLGSMLKR